MRALPLVVLLALGACEKPPPERADVGDDCSDLRCEDGLVCVDLGDGETSTCAEPDASCDPEEICACDVLEELCPDDNVGNVCVTFSGRVSLECLPPEGGEGEGEGE